MLVFNQAVTVFNRYINPETKQSSWHRTVLTDCRYVTGRVQTLSGQTLTAVNATTVRVLSGIHHQKYNPPKAYIGEGFTLNIDDIICKGEVDFDLTDQNRLEFLKAHIGEAFVIKSFADNTGDNPLKATSHYKAVSV